MDPTSVERKLTAIMSADVQGYSRLMGEELLEHDRDDEQSPLLEQRGQELLSETLLSNLQSRLIALPWHMLLLMELF